MRSSRWRANSPPVPGKSGRSAECRSMTFRTHTCGSMARPRIIARKMRSQTKRVSPVWRSQHVLCRHAACQAQSIEHKPRGGHQMVAIAILDDYQHVALQMADWSRLQENHRITAFEAPFADEDAAARALVGFDVVCLMRERTPFPASLIERLPNLRLIVTSGPQNAAIDIAAAAKKNVMVCGTPSPGHPTAELTMGLMLSLARNIHTESAAMLTGGWQRNVGRARRGQALGMTG